MCTGPSQAPAAPPPSPPAWSCQVLMGVTMVVGAARCLHPCVLPRLFSPLSLLDLRGFGGRGQAERQSGCLDLRVQEQGSNEQSVF